jgi:hypothetical protein
VSRWIGLELWAMGVLLGWWSQDLVLVLFGGDDVGCAREYRSGARETLSGYLRDVGFSLELGYSR